LRGVACRAIETVPTLPSAPGGVSLGARCTDAAVGARGSERPEPEGEGARLGPEHVLGKHVGPACPRAETMLTHVHIQVVVLRLGQLMGVARPGDLMGRMLRQGEPGTPAHGV